MHLDRRPDQDVLVKYGGITSGRLYALGGQRCRCVACELITTAAGHLHAGLRRTRYSGGEAVESRPEAACLRWSIMMRMAAVQQSGSRAGMYVAVWLSCPVVVWLCGRNYAPVQPGIVRDEESELSDTGAGPLLAINCYYLRCGVGCQWERRHLRRCVVQTLETGMCVQGPAGPSVPQRAQVGISVAWDWRRVP